MHEEYAVSAWRVERRLLDSAKALESGVVARALLVLLFEEFLIELF
jgi:hypothetical protein